MPELAGSAAPSIPPRDEWEQHLLVSLTKREREIFGLFLGSLRWPEIAARMGINPKDIHKSKWRIVQKLGLASEVGLVLFAVRHGIVSA